jgi:hypothetical protein
MLSQLYADVISIKHFKNDDRKNLPKKIMNINSLNILDFSDSVKAKLIGKENTETL